MGSFLMQMFLLIDVRVWPLSGVVELTAATVPGSVHSSPLGFGMEEFH